MTTPEHAALVRVYSPGPGCQPCRLTAKALSRAGIPHEIIYLPDLAPDEVAQVTHGHTTAPVVHTPDGRVWSGYQPALIATLTNA